MLWERITCPALLLRGTKSWASDPALDGRLAAFRNARFENVEGAGHWVHHDRLTEFLALMRDFLGAANEPVATDAALATTDDTAACHSARPAPRASDAVPPTASKQHRARS